MGAVYGINASGGYIWSDQTPSLISTPAQGQSAAASTAGDVTEVTSVPIVSTAQELEGNNPTQFHQVVTDAVAKLKVAAEQTADPFAASYLSDLANRFQLMLDSSQS
jgi:hypothetical protein